MALLLKYAFDASMDTKLANLMRVVPSHFAHSIIRREDFLNLKDLMDMGESDATDKSPFERYCETRHGYTYKLSLLIFFILYNA